MSALRFLLKSGSASSASRIRDMICVESIAGLDSLFAKWNDSADSKVGWLLWDMELIKRSDV